MVLHKCYVYICCVLSHIKPLMPAAYGGRYRSTYALLLGYVLFLYVRIYSCKCMLVLTLLLHMIYVLLLVLYGISGRAFAAIWSYTLCDRYAITFIFTCIFMTFHDGYFWTHHRVSVQP